MRTRISGAVMGAAVLGGLAGTLPCQGEVRYSILNLGGLSTAGAEPMAINNLGQVAGGSYVPYQGQWEVAPFRTQPNQPIQATDILLDLPHLIGGTNAAWDLNDAGQAVVNVAGNMYRTAPNAPINQATDDIGNLGFGTPSPAGINNSGQVTGISWVDGSGGNKHAYRTGPNAKIVAATDDLGGLVAGRLSQPRDLNDLGQIVGTAIWTDSGYQQVQHAFRTAPQGPINPLTDDLGTLGGTNSYGVAINASGQVAGSSNPLGSTDEHAFRTQPNAKINPLTDDLGTLGGTVSAAKGINASGTTVGWSRIAPNDHFTERAFVAYPDGPMINLNTLIDPSSGWVLRRATAINDLGQIVGLGDYNGKGVAYLLTPVPEPASLSLLALGAMALLARVPTRHRRT